MYTSDYPAFSICLGEFNSPQISSNFSSMEERLQI